MLISRKTPAVLAVLVLGVATSPVHADSASTEAILRECAQDGVIADGHTPAELRAASANMPADAREYTDCPRQIELALDRALATPTPKTAAGDAGSAMLRGFQSPAARVSPAELAAALAQAEVDGASSAAPDPGELQAGGDGAAGTTAAGPSSSSRAEPEAGDPAAKTVGNAVAAATVGASLLALARPAMLRRRRLDDDA